jgi:hypothetical protein
MWRSCAQHVTPFAKACLCRSVGGRKGRSNRVVCDKVLGSFSAAMLQPVLHVAARAIVLPWAFFYVRVSLRRGTIRSRYLRCVIIGQSLFCVRRAEQPVAGPVLAEGWSASENKVADAPCLHIITTCQLFLGFPLAGGSRTLGRCDSRIRLGRPSNF